MQTLADHDDTQYTRVSPGGGRLVRAGEPRVRGGPPADARLGHPRHPRRPGQVGEDKINIKLSTIFRDFSHYSEKALFLIGSAYYGFQTW